MRHVRAESPVRIAADLRWWDVIAIIGVGGGFIAVALAGIVSNAPPGAAWSKSLFGAVCFVVMVMGSPLWMFTIIGLLQRRAWRRSSRRARALLPGLPRSTWAEIAGAEHVESMLASRGLRPLDAARWSGPRIVVFDLELPDVLDCPDPAEPTRLDGPDRRRRPARLSRGERVVMWLMAFVVVVVPGLVFILLVDWQLGLIVLGISAAAVGTVRVAGAVLRQNPYLARPLDLASTIVTPGRVERSIYGWSRVFDRNECVLVIEPRRRPYRGGPGGRLIASLVPRAGKPLRLEFAGVDDPALHDLLGRWEFAPAERREQSVTRL